MRTKYTFLLPLFLLVSLLAYSQKKNIVNSVWHTDIFSPADGLIPRDAFSVDEESKLLYLVSNDNEKLYVHLIVNERNSVRSILEEGLTIWIDPEGRNKRRLGARFPLIDRLERPDRAERRTVSELSTGVTPPDRLPNFSSQNMNIELLGFFDTKSTIIPNNEPRHINGFLSTNEFEELVYRLEIPYLVLGSDTFVNKTISINIFGTTQSQSGPSQGAPQQGAMGGTPGGGSGGRPGAGGSGPPQVGGGGPPAGVSQTGGMIKIKLKRIRLVNG